MNTLQRYTYTLWGLLRPQTYILLSLHVLIAFSLAVSLRGGVTFSNAIEDKYIELITALVLTGLWYIHAAGINDIADYEIDRVNLPKAKDRPLQNGQSTKSELIVIEVMVSASILLLSPVIGVHVFVLSALVLFLSWAYSMKPIRISYRGVLAPLLLPIGYVVYPFLLGLFSYSRFTSEVVLVLISLYAAFIARVMLKDFRDVVGDKKFGKYTFLIQTNARFVTLSSTAVYLLSLLYMIFGIYRFDYSIAPILTILCFAVVSVRLYQKLLKAKNWISQKKVLPYLSRAMSAQSITILGYFIFLTGEFSFVYLLCFLLAMLYAIYETTKPSQFWK